MRIAINATFRLHGGNRIHLLQLLKNWSKLPACEKNEFVIFTRPENARTLEGYVGDRKELCVVNSLNNSILAKLFWEQLVLPKLLEQLKVDVLYCPVNIVPLSLAIPSVTSFRNAAPFCSGINIRSVGVKDWLYFRLVGVMMRLSSHYARRVIFVSNYLKNIFVHRFGFSPERGDVIYHGRDGLLGGGSSSSFPFPLPIPYILSVSNLYPYKNIPALLEGYAMVRKTMQKYGLRLMLVGQPRSEKYRRFLLKVVHQLGIENSVMITGGVPYETLGPILQGCELYVFQSTCENCPITLIEALAAELPIACSNAGVMPEIAGDAAVYFDPLNPKEIASALLDIVENVSLRFDLTRKAKDRAQKFPTWEEVAKKTLSSLEHALL